MRGPGKETIVSKLQTTSDKQHQSPRHQGRRTLQTLADCWERTQDMAVPQFRDGECEARRLWDEAVADVMGWDADELATLA